jgi:hypothetical protein
LLPPDLRSRLPPDHPGRLVDDLVESLSANLW